MLHDFCFPGERRRDSALHGPTTVNATGEHARCDTEVLRPLHHVHGLATPREDVLVATRASVGELHVLRRPTAVVRGVIAVTVDAVEGVRERRPRAHVGEERREVVPPGADADTPPAVVAEPRRTRVTATSAHLEPDDVLGSSGLTVTSLRMVKLTEVVGVHETVPAACKFAATARAKYVRSHVIHFITRGAA